MKKILFFLPVILLLGAACDNIQSPSAQQNQQTAAVAQKTPGEITSFAIEPSREQDGWLLYKDGATAVVRGKNLTSVTIRYLPTWAGTGSEYSRSVLLGEMRSLSSQVDTWALPMPKHITATRIWVEANITNGVITMPVLGNVGYEEADAATIKIR